MDASVVVAICATVIAVVSLAVSVYEARAMQRHNRISVRPFLELRVGLSQGRSAGLQLINAGLGPAAITRTVLTLDGRPLGEFSEASVNVLRSKLSVRPAAVTFRRTILAADYDQFLLSVDSFDRTEHAEFADLLRHRLGMEILDRPGFFGGTFLPDVINLPFFPAVRSSFPRILSGECTCRRSAAARCYTSQPIPGSRA